jgi:23S rRNA pseudouridine2605 synthase
MHPSFGVEKVYRAEVKGAVGRNEIRKFREGLVLDDGPAAPAELEVILADTDSSLVKVILHQGRKHQVRRMLDAVGHPVRTLDRLSFGGLTAEDVPIGSRRNLSGEEIAMLKKLTGLDKEDKTD